MQAVVAAGGVGGLAVTIPPHVVVPSDSVAATLWLYIAYILYHIFHTICFITIPPHVIWQLGANTLVELVYYIFHNYIFNYYHNISYHISHHYCLTFRRQRSGHVYIIISIIMYRYNISYHHIVVLSILCCGADAFVLWVMIIEYIPNHIYLQGVPKNALSETGFEGTWPVEQPTGIGRPCTLKPGFPKRQFRKCVFFGTPCLSSWYTSALCEYNDSRS